MAWDHALKMQTSHNIYLFMARFSVKYTIYRVELETIKKSAGKGVLLSQWQNIAEATPPVRNKKENQRSQSLLSIVNSKLFYIFPLKELLCIVCKIHIFSTGRGCYYVTMKEAIS